VLYLISATLFFGVGVVWTAIGMRSALLSALGGLDQSAAAELGAFEILRRLVDGGILLALSTTIVGVVPSIELVIYCAVGGRLSILGAVYGALLVNWAKTVFSESFPELWLFGLGALFISVVVLFPNGLAGIYSEKIAPRIRAMLTRNTSEATPEGMRKAPVRVDAAAE